MNTRPDPIERRFNNRLETLTRKYVVFIVFLLVPFLGAVAQPEKDVDGGKDHPLLSRMPGYYLSQYETKDFDVYTTAYLSGKDAQWEGNRTTQGYTRTTGSKNVSMVQIEAMSGILFLLF